MTGPRISILLCSRRVLFWRTRSNKATSCMCPHITCAYSSPDGQRCEARRRVNCSRTQSSRQGALLLCILSLPVKCSLPSPSFPLLVCLVLSLLLHFVLLACYHGFRLFCEKLTGALLQNIECLINSRSFFFLLTYSCTLICLPPFFSTVPTSYLSNTGPIKNTATDTLHV